MVVMGEGSISKEFNLEVGTEIRREMPASY